MRASSTIIAALFMLPSFSSTVIRTVIRTEKDESNINILLVSFHEKDILKQSMLDWFHFVKQSIFLIGWNVADIFKCLSNHLTKIAFKQVYV